VPLSIDDVHDSCLQMPHEQVAGQRPRRDATNVQDSRARCGTKGVHATQELFVSQIHNNGRVEPAQWAYETTDSHGLTCCIAAAIFQRVSFTGHTDAELRTLANLAESAPSLTE
jgi:hypothetical protein